MTVYRFSSKSDLSVLEQKIYHQFFWLTMYKCCLSFFGRPASVVCCCDVSLSFHFVIIFVYLFVYLLILHRSSPNSHVL